MPDHPVLNLQSHPSGTVIFIRRTDNSGLASVLGHRFLDDGLEWRRMLDPLVVPALADHRVGGQVLLPGAAFLEIGLAAARAWLGSTACTFTGSKPGGKA